MAIFFEGPEAKPGTAKTSRTRALAIDAYGPAVEALRRTVEANGFAATWSHFLGAAGFRVRYTILYYIILYYTILYYTILSGVYRVTGPGFGFRLRVQDWCVYRAGAHGVVFFLIDYGLQLRSSIRIARVCIYWSQGPWQYHTKRRAR